MGVRHPLPDHHSTAALDAHLGTVRDLLDFRSFVLRNARRTTTMLGLVRLHLNGVDNARRYSELLRSCMPFRRFGTPDQRGPSDRRAHRPTQARSPPPRLTPLSGIVIGRVSSSSADIRLCMTGRDRPPSADPGIKGSHFRLGGCAAARKALRTAFLGELTTAAIVLAYHRPPRATGTPSAFRRSAIARNESPPRRWSMIRSRTISAIAGRGPSSTPPDQATPGCPPLDCGVTMGWHTEPRDSTTPGRSPAVREGRPHRDRRVSGEPGRSLRPGSDIATPALPVHGARRNAEAP